MAEHRIIVDMNICGGKPCIKGTRIMVSNILGMFAGGYTLDKILNSYGQLTEEDVMAAIEYARDIIDDEKIIPA